ncbi:UNVERIFIED_CONTAM: hypothetical protein NCL1_09442 [Trichonephila clavipes]
MQSGHADFGQGGYQQYAFAPALSSGNSGHDMTKPVAAAQPGMPYAAGMPTSAQHHQSSMGGPVPSPQPIMQQGQQISRAPLSFYRGNSVPRSMPNMSRNPLTAVVNQPSQQATSQFSHVQMVPSPSYHMPPMIMNNFHQMPSGIDIVACLFTSSSPVPLKTRCVGQQCTLNLLRAETSSRWCGVVVRRGEGVPAHVSSTSLDHGSKLRGPSPKALM